jgi:hypothetical protein
MSLHRDLRSRVFDIVEIALGEFDGGRSNVLLQAMQLRGARNWDDPGLLPEDPRQCDLGRRCLFPLSNLTDQVDQGLVRPAGLWVEARDYPKLIPIQPNPIAETSKLLLPSLRFCMAPT